MQDASSPPPSQPLHSRQRGFAALSEKWIDQDMLGHVIAMGFSKCDAELALRNTGNVSVENAIEFLLLSGGGNGHNDPASSSSSSAPLRRPTPIISRRRHSIRSSCSISGDRKVKMRDRVEKRSRVQAQHRRKEVLPLSIPPPKAGKDGGKTMKVEEKPMKEKKQKGKDGQKIPEEQATTTATSSSSSFPRGEPRTSSIRTSSPKLGTREIALWSGLSTTTVRKVLKGDERVSAKSIIAVTKAVNLLRARGRWLPTHEGAPFQSTSLPMERRWKAPAHQATGGGGDDDTCPSHHSSTLVDWNHLENPPSPKAPLQASLGRETPSDGRDGMVVVAFSACNGEIGFDTCLPPTREISLVPPSFSSLPSSTRTEGPVPCYVCQCLPRFPIHCDKCDRMYCVPCVQYWSAKASNVAIVEKDMSCFKENHMYSHHCLE